MTTTPDARTTRNLVFWNSAPSPSPTKPKRRGASASADPDEDDDGLPDEEDAPIEPTVDAEGSDWPRWSRPSMYVEQFESARLFVLG
jgi:hypothetical protein